MKRLLSVVLVVVFAQCNVSYAMQPDDNPLFSELKNVRANFDRLPILSTCIDDGSSLEMRHVVFDLAPRITNLITQYSQDLELDQEPSFVCCSNNILFHNPPKVLSGLLYNKPGKIYTRIKEFFIVFNIDADLFGGNDELIKEIIRHSLQLMKKNPIFTSYPEEKLYPDSGFKEVDLLHDLFTRLPVEIVAQAEKKPILELRSFSRDIAPRLSNVFDRECSKQRLTGASFVCASNVNKNPSGNWSLLKNLQIISPSGDFKGLILDVAVGVARNEDVLEKAIGEGVASLKLVSLQDEADRLLGCKIADVD